nr:hypothetical protein [Mycolicibacterium komanii]
MAALDVLVHDTALLDASAARAMVGVGAMRTRPAAAGRDVDAFELPNETCSAVTGAKYGRRQVG